MGRPRRPARSALSGEPPTPAHTGSGCWYARGAMGAFCSGARNWPDQGDVLALAQPQQQVELLGEQRVIVRQALPEDGKRLGECAAARDDLGAAVADQVESGEVLVDADGVQHAQHRDRAGQPDGLGAGGDGGEDDGRGGHREGMRVMLAECEQVQAEPLGELGVADDLANALDGGKGPAGAGVGLDVAEGQDSEFHGVFSSVAGPTLLASPG